MPLWLQIVLWVAAGLTACGVIWTKAIRPLVRFIAKAEEMIPLLKELNKVFRDTPNAFKVLDEIVAQFRTDSGSSLRDVVNRLDEAAKQNKAAGELLKIGVEAARQLAEQDRAQLQRLIILLDRVTVKVDAGAATGLRNERAAGIVAEDLAAAHARADAATSTDAGAAADAAASSPVEAVGG